jgi:hypothetical protein
VTPVTGEGEGPLLEDGERLAISLGFVGTLEDLRK